eukprot:COSAG01_NODE_41280_length_453_cov_1.556497_1_plen_99_part_10
MCVAPHHAAQLSAARHTGVAAVSCTQQRQQLHGWLLLLLHTWGGGAPATPRTAAVHDCSLAAMACMAAGRQPGSIRGHGKSLQPGFWNNYVHVHKSVFS